MKTYHGGTESHLTGKTGKKGRRVIKVTLEANSGKLAVGDMIRESIASRGTIGDEFQDPAFVGKTFYNLGKLPAWILAGSIEHWHIFVYAAEMLRIHPDWADGHPGLEELRTNKCYGCGCNRHPSLDKMPDFFTSWGDVDEAPIKPVREQLKEAQANLIDRTRSEAVPAQPAETDEGPYNAYLAKWVMAEKRARQPRASWEGKADVEFEAMIKYCYGWLKDIGEVPQPYPMGTIDLFWQRPRPGEIKMSAKAVERRNFVTYKVMKFWRKSMAQPDVKDTIQLGRDPLSYRVVMAAQKLATAIEFYADPDPIHGEDDDLLMKSVRKAALRYFQAHFPVELEGAKPGPLATLDPGYVEYIQLCRKYGLKEGVLLHEAEL